MKDGFREEINRLKQELAKLVAARKGAEGDPDEWLRSLLAVYSDRFRHDNERIWTIGATLLPLSVSAFGVVAALDHPQRWQIVVLGFGSLGLIWSWLFVAENQRAFQQKSEAWMIAIQEFAGINCVGGQKIKGNWLNRLLTFTGAVQAMRWGLMALVTIGWVILYVLQAFGRLDAR